MKQPTRPVCWFGRLSDCLVVWTPLLFLRTFHRLYKNQKAPPPKKSKQKKKQRMQGRNKQTHIQNCKTQNSEVGTFKHSSVYYLWLSREFSENSTQLPKVLTHLVIVFTARCLRSWLHTDLRLLWTHILELTDQPHVLALNFWYFAPEFHS